LYSIAVSFSHEPFLPSIHLFLVYSSPVGAERKNSTEKQGELPNGPESMRAFDTVAEEPMKTSISGS
jgi:hypothetical protein